VPTHATRLRKWLVAALLLGLAACRTPPAGLSPESVPFASLPGWQEDELADALPAFRRSCPRLVTLSPTDSVGRVQEDAVATATALIGNWEAACAAAKRLPDNDNAQARAFFERYLQPHLLSHGQGGRALFTGYYEPEVAGARTRGGVYQTPVFRRPAVPAGTNLPDRAAIVGGALDGQGLELAWLADPVDAFFLQIQGSGRVRLPDGQVLRVGYAGGNGKPYVAIGRVLVERGAMALEKVTMQSIRSWLQAHPDQADAVMNANPSYVFFREIGDVPPEMGAIGSLGVPLAPGRSLAVDRSYVALGVPVYVATGQPAHGGALQRLFLAQDTGGAIKGPVRGDIFFGWDQEAATGAGLMKKAGAAWVLLPRPKPL